MLTSCFFFSPFCGCCWCDWWCIIDVCEQGVCFSFRNDFWEILRYVLVQRLFSIWFLWFLVQLVEDKFCGVLLSLSLSGFGGN